MKTIIQTSVLFVLVIMITITSISLVTHHALKTELISAVSNGTEQTLNMMLIYEAYPHNSDDEIIVDVLQNILLSKSSEGTITVNIYNKERLADGILEVEAIENYSGLGRVSRQASYRTRAYVFESEGVTYLKHADADLNATLSEQWVFTPEMVTNVKAFLETSKFPSQERNNEFLTRFSGCKQIIVNNSQ